MSKEAIEIVRRCKVGSRTVAAKSECPDLGTLNLTSFAQHVAFNACQKPQSRKVLTKEVSKTFGSCKVGSCKDGCCKVGMSRFRNLKPYIFCPTCRILLMSEAAKSEDAKFEDL